MCINIKTYILFQILFSYRLSQNIEYTSLCCIVTVGYLFYISVQFSHSVVSDSSRPHGLQDTRPPCPSPTLGVYSNLCPLNPRYNPTTSFCHPLLLLPSIFPGIRVFLNESVLHLRWQKYWSFSFSLSPSNEYSGLTSFRMD